MRKKELEKKVQELKERNEGLFSTIIKLKNKNAEEQLEDSLKKYEWVIFSKNGHTSIYEKGEEIKNIQSFTFECYDFFEKPEITIKK